MTHENDARDQTNSAPSPPPPPVGPKNEIPDGENGARGGAQNQDGSDDKLDRDMVKWTRAVAILTGCLFGAALLQWCSMKGQLAVMRSDQSGAAAQLSAAQTLASDTRSLATAAADQARAASAQAAAMSSMANDAKRQLDSLKTSVAAARQSADAARDQNKIAKDALAANTRAWLAPSDISIEKLSDFAYHVIISVTNTGKVPAFDVHDKFADPIVRVSSFDQIDKVAIGHNTACDGIDDELNRQVLYPAAVKRAFSVFYVRPINPNEIIIIQGCFAYKTLNIRHESSFCVFTVPNTEPLEKRPIVNCADGNGAD